ncbi:hypothetical protein UFOVP541_25 [uncultured Caudovirales phage]|uniref:Uncharacterized protein n=1 Tax=uncultured Caudovirales phage TaxID=2100421 RepID=A0A6J5MRE8_9CAUD|nr:hypothetical protein UFOVP541_25 [uncultured Caudovirales phage]
MANKIVASYTIDDNNAVWGFVSGQEAACLFQPNWPDGETFTDEADATVFAEAWIAHMNDPENNAFVASRPE